MRMNMQCWCISEDECSAVCSWPAGVAAAETWSCQHRVLSGAVFHHTGTLLDLITMLHRCGL